MSGARPPEATGRRLAFALRCACDTARLMVGMPSYDAYLAHMARTHPDRAPMSYPEFFRNRQDARFGAKSSSRFRCC
jgi:uncharacterized short protein YbdD (DUF466 family)